MSIVKILQCKCILDSIAYIVKSQFWSIDAKVLMSMSRLLQSQLSTHDRQTDVRTDSPCVLQDFVPFGAAALLLSNLAGQGYR